MDSTQFDDLLRAIAARSSRRGIVASLVGSLVGILPLPPGTREAEAKKCPPCRKKRDGRCKKKRPNGTQCGGPCKECHEGDCVDKANGASCGTGKLCAAGNCVTGQGTCAVGDDHCAAGNAACNGVGSSECACLTTTSGVTRCVHQGRLGDCGGCDSDDDCAVHGPEAFCVDIGHGTCGCPPDQPAWCMRPCPV